MADSSHLERMGRELKCPICLSLLNSVVSLTSDHVFCNLCIEKSIKSTSSCTVSKVPYRRREVHPAHHMDTLVSIYKNMEVASDEDNLAGGGRICGRQESSRICQEVPENPRRCKGKWSKQSLNINHENSNLDPVKPSFPTKKRVQVPQYPPPSETPVHPTTFEGGCGEITKLRDDEDVEKLTQQTHGGDNIDTAPNAPCFSDIKDSADEIPSKVVPEGGTNTTCNDVNYFGSEMFEWTQRSCSSELCSSPIKIQVKDCKLSTQAVTTNGKHGIKKMENVVSKQWK
ncbi:Protein BREAST CANCER SUSCEPTIBILITY like [Actinidia chinensis var. chinensis]|uniref:Protein BREAST CANCER SUSCEPTIBILITY like n=1 Tax=Actinidia chinensis var. chinensis TaxID=1590841 RepID=A0A2R6RG81_ACTCC|nr:Protein BREAST CANCER SUSCEPTIBILITY like [Actinidia chinensis var. chinensis]